MSKIRKSGVPAVALRSIASKSAPGPRMERLLLISNSALVKVIAPATEKTIVSPGAELAITWRSEPVPLSAVVVTVLVAAIMEYGKRANINSQQQRAFLI